jgi:ribosomal protein L37E
VSWWSLLWGWLLVSLGFGLGWAAAFWYRQRLAELGLDGPPTAYRCQLCGATSYDPWDVQRRHCSVCHRFWDGSKLGDGP